MTGAQGGARPESECCRTATHSMRNYSRIAGFCITLPAEKARTRNTGRRFTVYSVFLTADARAFTARRIRRIFDGGFVNLITSTAE